MTGRASVEPGTLYVVGTPIGNLGDIGARALGVLGDVDTIVAEDTRHTRALLSHFQIRGKKLVSLESHATERAVNKVVERLAAGESVAYVTDAGMPSVSDPGAALVRAARRANLPVRAVPGPSALTAAVAVSGLVEGPFVFFGFLPRKGTRRKEALARAVGSELPVVIFEAPRRTASTLRELAELSPEHEASVSRELTKLHEETISGQLSELAQREGWRGEVVIVVGARGEAQAAASTEDLDALVEEGLGRGLSTRDLARELGERLGLPRRELYAAIAAKRSRRNG